jgi:hypothetical protein
VISQFSFVFLSVSSKDALALLIKDKNEKEEAYVAAKKANEEKEIVEIRKQAWEAATEKVKAYETQGLSSLLLHRCVSPFLSAVF